MTPSEILRAHVSSPTRETATRLTIHLAFVVDEIVRERPYKSLPKWLSRGDLRKYADAALAKAVANLPFVEVAEDAVADFVDSQVRAAIEPLFVRCRDDLINGCRSHSRWNGYWTGDGVEVRDQDQTTDDPRDEMTAMRDALLESIHDLAEARGRLTAAERAVEMLFDDCSLRQIREATRLRSTGIERAVENIRRKRKPR